MKHKFLLVLASTIFGLVFLQNEITAQSGARFQYYFTETPMFKLGYELSTYDGDNNVYAGFNIFFASGYSKPIGLDLVIGGDIILNRYSGDVKLLVNIEGGFYGTWVDGESRTGLNAAVGPGVLVDTDFMRFVVRGGPQFFLIKDGSMITWGLGLSVYLP